MYIEIRVSVDYQPRELTHACSRSDTEACDMCYVFNVNLTDSFDDRRSQCRLIGMIVLPHTDTNPKNLELAPPPVHHGHQVRPVSL